MIQELLVNGTALILGLITTLVGMGTSHHEDVVIAPPPMPALENFNPGIRPPTLEEVIYNLIQGAADTISSTEPSAPSQPTTPVTPPVSPSKPPVVVTPPLVIPPTVPDEPLPTPTLPDEGNSTTSLLKGTLVNIICIPAKGYNVHGISGSGIVIDSRGIIVTVAHVAQYFLLENYPTAGAGNCIIRAGGPAKNAYDAKLIYLSPDWIKENPNTIVTNTPKGTGKYDFAFLAITQSISGTPLPSSFKAARLASPGVSIADGDKVAMGSYGAEFLTSSEIHSSLYPTITFGSIKDAYKFAGSAQGLVDIFSVNAGAAAQEGSSGGGILNDDDRFIGVITTRTVKPDLSLRDLQALTIEHIRRSFKADTGKDLDTYLKGSLPSLVTAFEPEAAELLDVIDDSIHQ